MGLYVWIAIGCVVGLVARVITFRRIRTLWLEPVLMGIAGAAVGGWVGAQYSSEQGIDSLALHGMIAAAVGAAVLISVFLVTRYREQCAQVSPGAAAIPRQTVGVQVPTTQPQTKTEPARRSSRKAA